MFLKVYFVVLLSVFGCQTFALTVLHSTNEDNLNLKIADEMKKLFDNSAEFKSFSGLRNEFSALQSELRAVASLASQCADMKEVFRQYENDHTVVHWLKESVTELRHEIGEIASHATVHDASQSVKELRDVVTREVTQLRRELQDLKVREYSDEAKLEAEILEHDLQKSNQVQTTYFYFNLNLLFLTGFFI